ncbi:hypothetical protein [Coleofasciculus sp. FACHB-1120]|uniref:hypothetical protein n=1 Tax=Coleofasciculus sp. FACHB-1120 TaxID=2692783 RepID=UPI001689ECE4|nr:hypothetical protein [Coleofasciculus sp. FACHB-1120]MBD2743674.1 hypothetical protein [Coleofasciculus sp. FACHB-1120]
MKVTVRGQHQALVEKVQELLGGVTPTDAVNYIIYSQYSAVVEQLQSDSPLAVPKSSKKFQLVPEPTPISPKSSKNESTEPTAEDAFNALGL